MHAVIAGMLFLQVTFVTAFTYVGGSVITSGVKAISNDCGNEYPVEVVFGGNWFCPSEKK